MGEIRCPHCHKSLGGAASDGDGTLRVRLGIVLIDPDGEIHGPCPHCKADVVVANGELSKSLIVSQAKPEDAVLREIRPGVRVFRAP